MDEADSRGRITQFLLFLSLLIGIYLTSFHSYLLFHSLAELVSIMIFYSVFILAWNSRKISSNSYLQFIGISFLFIATIDLLHTLAYKGMGVFHGFDANLPTQLWIIARYLQASSFLIAPLFIGKKLNQRLLIYIYALATVVLLISVFSLGIFPDCYIEGFGLTNFKIISEYIISLILFGSAILLIKKRVDFEKNIFRFLLIAIILTIMAELAFTFYIGVYDLSNMIGHFFKIIASFLIYQALVKVGFEKPYSLLFWDLKKTEEQVVKLNSVLKLLNQTLRHDILNDLIVVGGNIDLYLQYGKKKIDLDQVMKDSAEAIKKDISFIGQMKDLEKAITSGVDLKPVEVQKVIQKVKKQFEGLEVYVDGKATIMADEALESVISNLIRNAQVHGQVNQVDIKIETQADVVKVSVIDGGKGIPDKVKDKLFTEGFKYGETGNSGLGLFIVKKVIDRYDGKIWIEDNKPQGTILVIEVPKK